MAPAPRKRGQPPVLKKYGQHFLTDKKILGAIVDALAPSLTDTVIEVGPGRGALTDILVERSGRLVGIEIDRALANQLNERYEGRPNVQIVQADVLETDLHAIAGRDFLLVGNVPYNITTPIVFKSLEPPIPRRSVFSCSARSPREWRRSPIRKATERCPSTSPQWQTWSNFSLCRQAHFARRRKSSHQS